MKNIIEALGWRYAVKKFDSNRKIDDEKFNTLLECLRLSPSSYGLQPWKFIIVNDLEVRKNLKAAGYNQSQITEASHLIVFSVPENIDDAFVDNYIKLTSEIRNIGVEDLKGFGDMIKNVIHSLTKEQLVEWATRQLYLSLGVLLSSCASLEIDACPMEGFDKDKFDEILDLKKLGLKSKVIITLGYRSSDDEYSKLKKVRNQKEDIFIIR